MNMKNILTVVFLGIPLVHGMPTSLKREVERAECVVMSLPPAPVPLEQFSEAQTTLENCIKNLRKCLSEDYDKEIEDEISVLELDLYFLEGCGKILLGEEGFDSPTAQQWIDTAYVFESYLNHFRGR